MPPPTTMKKVSDGGGDVAGGGEGWAEGLSCSVCMEPYNAHHRRPLMLPACGHSFCSNCLSLMLTRIAERGPSGGPLSCPSCRAPQQVAQISRLPVNYSLLQLATSDPAASPQRAQQPPRAEVCGSHGARLAFWCESCAAAACGECLYDLHPRPAHRTLKLHDHARTLITDMRHKSSELVSQLSALAEHNTHAVKAALVCLATHLHQRRTITDLLREARGARDLTKVSEPDLTTLQYVSTILAKLQQQLSSLSIASDMMKDTLDRVSTQNSDQPSSSSPSTDNVTHCSLFSQSPTPNSADSTLPQSRSADNLATSTNNTNNPDTSSDRTTHHKSPSTSLNPMQLAREGLSLERGKPQTPRPNLLGFKQLVRPAKPLRSRHAKTSSLITPSSPPSASDSPDSGSSGRDFSIPDSTAPDLTVSPTSPVPEFSIAPESPPVPASSAPVSSPVLMANPAPDSSVPGSSVASFPESDASAAAHTTHDAPNSATNPPPAPASSSSTAAVASSPWPETVCGVLSGVLSGSLSAGRVTLEPQGLHLYSFRPIKEKCDLFLNLRMLTWEAPDQWPLVFLDLNGNSQPLGRVYIKLKIELRRAQQFFLLCLGERGPSYRGSRFHAVLRRGGVGEGLAGGDYEGRTGKGGAAVLGGINPEHEVAKRCERGMVVRAGTRTETAAQFSISVRDGPRSKMVYPFGRVTAGLEVVEEACRRPALTVSVRDCGWVIPV